MLRVVGTRGIQCHDLSFLQFYIPGLGKLVGSMCAVSGVLVLSLPIPIIAGNFEAFHKNQQKMTKAEKGKKKLKAAKIAEFERRQLYCNNKMTSCPSTKSDFSHFSVLLLKYFSISDLASPADYLLTRHRSTLEQDRKTKNQSQDTFLYC